MNQLLIAQIKGSVVRYFLGLATGGVLCMILSLVVHG